VRVLRTLCLAFNSSSVTVRLTRAGDQNGTCHPFFLPCVHLNQRSDLLNASVNQQNHLSFNLDTFNDAIVSYRAGSECLKRLLVGLAFVSRQRNVVTVEFNNDGPLLQSSFVGLNLACDLVKKRPPNDSTAGTANAA
jgi:hypothetical protein